MIENFEIDNYYPEPELLGFWEIFGLGLDWREKVLSFMQKRSKGLDFGKYLRYTTIDNLNREYMTLLKSGYKPVEFSGLSTPDIDRARYTADSYSLLYKMINSLKLPFRIVDLYLRAIWYGAHLGAIPYSKWNPGDYAEKEDIRESWESEKNWLEKAKDMTGINMNKILLTGGALLGGFWILNNIVMEKIK